MTISIKVSGYDLRRVTNLATNDYDVEVMTDHVKMTAWQV